MRTSPSKINPVRQWIRSFAMRVSFLVLTGTTVYGQTSAVSDSLNPSGEEPIWVKSDEICQLLNDSDRRSTLPSKENAKKAKTDYTTGCNLVIQYRKSKDNQLLLQAQPYFESALQINRRDTTYQKAVHLVYPALIKQYAEQGQYSQAVILGERLVRLNSRNSRDFNLYLTLGNNYLKFRKFDSALANLMKAGRLLDNDLEQAGRTADPSLAARLKTQMFYVLFLQYQIHTELGRMQEAQEAIAGAAGYAQTDEEKRKVANIRAYLDRLDFWQDKEAFNLEQEINKRIKEKQVDQVPAMYEQLLQKFPDFTDPRRMETISQYSMVEFQHLERRPQAIERLLPYFQSYRDSVNRSPRLQNLINAFSSMCFIYGLSQFERDRFSGYCYLLQGYESATERKQKIGLELLKCSVNDPVQSLRMGLELWEKKDRLNESEFRTLCEYLIYINKRNGDPEGTRRFYEEYQKMNATEGINGTAQ
jgi:tetratricopeptide (TPR) repeat protein